MIHFHGICHGEFDLRYVGGFLKFRKLDFGRLRGQFDVKKANFRGLIAEIGHYNHILASRINLWPIFMDYTIGIVALMYAERILELTKLNFRGFQGRFDVKKSIVRGITIKMCYLWLILASRPHLCPIFIAYRTKRCVWGILKLRVVAK